MKIIFTLLLTLCSLLLLSQDDCTGSLTINKDKFTGEISIFTPLDEPLSINKIVEKTKTYYFLSASVIGVTATVGRKGLYILFSDGTKFIRQNESIDTKVNKYGSGFEYSAFIELTKKEVEIFSKKTVTDVKLYIYDREVDGFDSSQFKCYVAAILKAN